MAKGSPVRLASSIARDAAGSPEGNRRSDGIQASVPNFRIVRVPSRACQGQPVALARTSSLPRTCPRWSRHTLPRSRHPAHEVPRAVRPGRDEHSPDRRAVGEAGSGRSLSRSPAELRSSDSDPATTSYPSVPATLDHERSAVLPARMTSRRGAAERPARRGRRSTGRPCSWG